MARRGLGALVDPLAVAEEGDDAGLAALDAHANRNVRTFDGFVWTIRRRGVWSCEVTGGVVMRQREFTGATLGDRAVWDIMIGADPSPGQSYPYLGMAALAHVAAHRGMRVRLAADFGRWAQDQGVSPLTLEGVCREYGLLSSTWRHYNDRMVYLGVVPDFGAHVAAVLTEARMLGSSG